MKKTKISIIILLLVLVYLLPNNVYADDNFKVNGVVWWDQNGGDNCGGPHNGLREDGEQLLNNLRVELLVKQPPGSFFEGQYRPMNPQRLTWTDANGYYSFENVPAGDYKVLFYHPGQLNINGITINNFTYTTPNVNNSPGDLDINSDATTEVTDGIMTYSFILDDQHTEQKLDGGFIGYCLPNFFEYELGDFVWLDDGDGIQEPGEPGIPGVTVTATAINNGMQFTETTDANGHYNFYPLEEGFYTLEFTMPNGYIETKKNVGSDSKDSDGLVIDDIYLFSDNNSYDLGLIKVSSIGDLVWDDTNKNGIQDDGEPGVAGIKVTLTKPDGSTVETTTDANGNYSFNDVVPGEYNIKFTDLPEGYEPTITNAGGNVEKDSNGVDTTFSVANSNNLSIDLGIKEKEKPKYQLGDYVWLDVDKNGIQDGTEQGIAGIKVTLTKPDNTTDETTTDQNGMYVFEGLESGNYKVEFSNIPADLLPTITDSGSNDEVDSDGVTVNVTIDATNDLSVDLGLVEKEEPVLTYRLGDMVWFDINKDGIENDVAGVPNVTVTLTKPDGTTETTTTDQTGMYEFKDLVNGDYKVEFSDLPEGYEATISNAGSDDSVDSDGLSVNVTIADRNDFSIDLGIVKKEEPAPTYKLGDTVWFDIDKDGIENDIAGVPNVTVTLTKPDGTTETTTTDQTGMYEFKDLVNGDYKVEFSDLPEGYEATISNAGSDDSVDSDGLSVDVTIADHDDFSIDLGIIKKEEPAPTYKLGDFVWYDNNGDGLQDKDSMGVQGVKVELFDPKGNLLSETTTDENGMYLFKNLKNGIYRVVFSNLPEGYKATKTNEGNDRTIDSNGLDSLIEIKDADNLTVALGLVKKEVQPAPTYKLGDFVWVDSNKDGIQDDDEKGLAGIKVTLTHSDGTTEETTTNENGYYVFDGLVNGEYTVTFSHLPEGYVVTKTDVGSDDSKDSDGLEADVMIKDADNMTLDLGVYEKETLPKTGVGSGTYYQIIGLIAITFGLALLKKKSVFIK